MSRGFERGFGDVNVDAWGTPKVSQNHSLFHGMFTFDVPASMWLVYEDDVEVVNSASTGAVSTDGALVMDTSAGALASVQVSSRRHPRYQPNRGHHFATALWCPNKTNDGVRDFGLFTADDGAFFRLKSTGALHAYTRSGGVDTDHGAIDTSGISGFDVEKGNVYDIQFQWRGVGNYKFFINLTLVKTIENLGTLTVLSIENPALAIAFRCENTTADVSMYVGCADVSSEGGQLEREQYGSIVGSQSGNNTDYPVISIRNPALIATRENTRDLRLARISASSTAKVTIKVWKTRSDAALTGESWTALGNGSYVEYDDTATAMVTANAVLITQFKVEANASALVDNPSRESIDFYVTHGDIIIVSYTGNATVDAVIEWGEEI